MGRVYNALVKSGSWSDAPGAVARPAARVIAARKLHPAAEPGYDFETDFAPQTGANRPRKYPAPVLVPPPPNWTRSAVEQEVTKSVETPEPVASSIVPEDPSRREGVYDEPPARQATPVVEPEVVHLPRVVRPSNPAESDGSFFTDCPVVRVIAGSADPHMVGLTGDRGLAAERYQTLAVRIFNLAQKRGVKSVLVTSALENEGKTTVAANLAALMAKPSERRILLVDSDLRRPSIAGALGVPLRKGWREVLEGRAGPYQSIVRLEPIGLYLLAGSAAAPRPLAAPIDSRSLADRVSAGDLFASSRPEEIIRELEQHFSLVIIDSPPILSCAESQRLASIADATIIVAKAGRTAYGAAQDAVKLVPKERRLGIVLNQSSLMNEAAYYGVRREGAVSSFFGRRRKSR